MAEKESIKRFIVRDPHGHVEQEDSFSVVGDVEVTVDGNVGEPSAESTYENGQLKIDFHNMKGDTGNGITDIEVDEQEGDEAINTVTIKTEDNPEGTAFQVRNGSRGNGIVSISEQVSDQDGGVNTFTIADSDGTQYDIHTRNGRKGDKGDPGDSVIVGEGDLPLAHVTGQSTEKAISQKGFTDALEEQYTKVLEGQEGNYLIDKCVNYQGNIIDRPGWCCFKEPIPCDGAVTQVIWRPKNDASTDSEARLYYYDANMAKVYAKTLPSATSWTDNNPGAKVKFINVSFKADVDIPLTITMDGVKTDYPRIDKKPALNDVEEFSEDLASLDERLTAEETKGEYRLHVKSDTAFESTGAMKVFQGWAICTNFIPCVAGEKVQWRYGSTTKYDVWLIFYNADKQHLSHYSQTSGSPSRTVTADTGAAYVRVCWYETYNGEDNTTPLIIGGRTYFVDDLSKLRQMEIDLYSKDTAHGVIGEFFPEEAHDVAVMGIVPDKDHFKMLWFLHTSDNHGSNFGYAEDFANYCAAKFVVNTGDLVLDKFTDSKAQTIASAIAPNKPTYLVLGNHDYNKATSKQAIFDAFYGDPETEGTVNYHNVQTGGVAVEHTWYSVDDATSNTKCIFLDMNDGWPDDGFSTRALSNYSIGNMSQEQIEWFIAQLQAARTAGQHVCIFIHILAVARDGERTIPEFTDSWTVDWDSTHTFLHDLVDKFMSGGNIEFTYQGNTYTATFSAGGHFIGWFCGHAHYDSAGWLRDYPNQFAVIVTRPNAQGMHGGIYQPDGRKEHFNFVAIDTYHRRLSVYRVGQQETVYGVDRKSFMVYYK